MDVKFSQECAVDVLISYSSFLDQVFLVYITDVPGYAFCNVDLMMILHGCKCDPTSD